MRQRTKKAPGVVAEIPEVSIVLAESVVASVQDFDTKRCFDKTIMCGSAAPVFTNPFESSLAGRRNGNDDEDSDEPV